MRGQYNVNASLKDGRIVLRGYDKRSVGIINFGKQMIVFVMGVSGCGKSTIAEKLSAQTGMPYFDADDFHPQENIDKMSRGEALTDKDRASWLCDLSHHLQQWDKDNGAVLACSALKENYRQILSKNLESCFWVYLSGTFDLIESRLNKRKGHYMGSELLRSQFDTLEVPEYGIHVDIEQSPEEILEKIKLFINE